MEEDNTSTKSKNFIWQIVENDINEGHSRISTRFPPEPNGCLHIGHAKAICLDFGTAIEYNGTCNLRFDDTNPTKEDVRFVEAIKEDIQWLGFKWDNLYYASEYFDKLFSFAIELIEAGKAYVCTLSPEEFKEYRGVPYSAGKNSPHRDRSIEENLRLFQEMKEGKYAEGEFVLRAKIDMASPNLHMRDPAIYRIKYDHHHNTGDKWCIYPMYDFAHCLSDAIEGITHSLCTLEFEVHRELYDWFIENTSAINLNDRQPRQYEFARLDLGYTMMSKRLLQHLVENNIVEGWDDPRMPTISGMRARGYTADAIKNFCTTIGITKYKGLTDFALLEHCIRQDLNKKALRKMAVFDPLEVEIENIEEDFIDNLDAIDNPEDENSSVRKVAFTKKIFIEREDFLEDAPKKFFRLSTNNEVRLRYAYFLKCKEVIKDANGNILKLICTIDKDSRGGVSPDGRKVKGTIHWVSTTENVKCSANLYDKLFTKEDMSDIPEGETFLDYLNKESLSTTEFFAETSALTVECGVPLQFERIAYFVKAKASDKENVFNRTITLKDAKKFK